MNASLAWQSVLGQLQLDMPKAAYDTWVRDTEFLSFEDGLLIIGVKNAYARDWLDGRLRSTVERILAGMLNRTVQVRFVVWQHQSEPESFEELTTLPTQSAVRNPTLISRYSFESFVVGSSNRLPHAACVAVVENPARAYNPLFLYGGVGLGKTHLLHAIGNECTNKNLQVLYVSSEEFTNDLINAIRTHTTQVFREKYRLIDVLLIDDIQFIAGKESTQEEFFHTFNTLYGQEKQIVISSDRPPKAMVTLEERLRSRFDWGLTVDIQLPDYETRMAVLRSKAEQMGRQLPHEILETIAKRVQSNIRELEGALNRVLALSNLIGITLTPQLVETTLADMLPNRQEVAPEQVIQVVAEFFGIANERMLGRERTQEVAFPRQVAMYLLREETGNSLPKIGEMLGGRDHTTVMYAVDKIADLLERDDRLRRQVVDIREKLYGQEQIVL
ncbi:MAG: chromosomal replication initiator protein DnaA [Chloroflexota bacterium]